MADTLLRIEGVGVSFGGLVVLSDVSFDVPVGDVVGVIGPNGAGKTTLFNIVCGFVRPTAGAVVLAGQDLRGVRPHRLTRLGIARTLQDLGLFSGLSVLENVLAGETHRSTTGLVGALLGAPWTDRDERSLRASAMDTLRRLDIAPLAARPCGTLPYGVRKRVALARALVGEPRLLLLDEPAAGLSETETTELAQILAGVRTSTTIMLVEHHMEFVMNLCERLVVLDHGQVIARGTPAEIRRDPAVQRAYLGDTRG